MNEIAFIVDTLNRPPFEKALTIVDFAQKSPVELLQIVNDIFTLIDESQRRDIRAEQRTPDIMQQRMLQFIIVLNYKHNMDLEQFRQAFFSGNTAVIYPLLQYVLSKFPDLKKRAYIAPFLRNIDPPEEFFADASVVSFYETYKKYQEDFKQTHKSVDTLRQTHNNPSDLQEGIETLVKEREQLQNKLGKLRERVQNPEYANLDFEAILQATHKLQRETEEDHKLYMKLQEMKQKLARAHQVKLASSQKLRALMQTDLANQDPQQLLEKKRKEVAQNRHYLNETLEQGIAEKRQQLSELERQISSDPMSAEEVAELEMELGQTQRAVDVLTTQRDNQLANSDGKIRFMRQRVVDLEKKNEAAKELLAEAEEEKKDVEEELQRLNTEYKAMMGNSERPQTEAQMKQFIKDLHAKTKLYKQLKAELQAGRQELQVLSRTEAILRSRDENIQDLQEELEREKGIEGFGKAQETLEAVSNQRSAIDHEKGTTLVELSQIVAKMNEALQKKTKKLAPQIAELQETRKQHAEVERVYKMKKGEFDKTVLNHESDRLHLDHDVEENMDGIQAEESNFHFLNGVLATTQAKIVQMEQENKYLAEPSVLHVQGKFNSFKDQYEHMIKERESANRDMKMEKRNVGETQEDNVLQRQMFHNLKKLLACKKILAVESSLKQSMGMPGDGLYNADSSMQSFDATVL